MFFLIRSAVCIGTVAVLATGGNQTGMGRVIDSGGRQVAQSLGRACVASNGCLRLGMDLVATGGQGKPRKGRGPLRSVGRYADGLGSRAGLDRTGWPTGGRVVAPASGDACAALRVRLTTMGVSFFGSATRPWRCRSWLRRRRAFLRSLARGADAASSIRAFSRPPIDAAARQRRFRSA